MQFLNRIYRFVLILMVALAITTGGRAQTNYGAVRGLAKDVQGAVIADATVTLTNVGTKLARTLKANEAGEYLFTAIAPGEYDIANTLTGFKTFKDHTTVDLGLTATVDAVLPIGSTTDTVEVTTADSLVDTASAKGGQLFNEQQLQELPNLGRNPFVF